MNGMVDDPGESREWRTDGKVELYTRVVCTKGSAAGTTIRSINWGVEMHGYDSDSVPREILFNKVWWPTGHYPKDF